MPTPSPRLSGVGDLYLTKPKLTPSWLAKSKQFWREFSECVGVATLREVTQDQVLAYHDKIIEAAVNRPRHMPPTRRPRGWDRRPLRQTPTDDGRPGLASNAFTKLGLNAAELAKLPADQAFSTIAQKISEIQNPAERATAAMQIFGKSGQSLLPLMLSVAEGIKAAQEEAAKLVVRHAQRRCDRQGHLRPCHPAGERPA